MAVNGSRFIPHVTERPILAGLAASFAQSADEPLPIRVIVENGFVPQVTTPVSSNLPILQISALLLTVAKREFFKKDFSHE